jgi:hypothetical protein
MVLCTTAAKGWAARDDIRKQKSELEEIIRKVRLLRSFTKTTGFFTTKSVGALLGRLSPDELVEVVEAFGMTPREIPRQ